ncbi:hypothetical protein HYH02_006030 [Chlamydomonas schloesseri]|uniref:N-alpha-acetyltransferase 40 n=1 Tax=Chlamydomonas schloesseri TaxID=2026947 RepID=A0A836B6A1_9CHLO|nr:hypothetical protein HYH02_006030 [Chlamydomonas schloesseri]|eukprot:KAG2448673.1 hypothetical protein HYH02_006030 [Chlamydomonas schloesseri]
MVGNKLSTVRAVLRKARQLKDPLNELVGAVRPCCVNGHAHQFRSHHAADLPKEQLEWCLDVCRENMAALYERVWSWNDMKKRRQLTSSASRFLIAYDINAARAPVGYINFRFEYEDGEAVMYCYELQVARAAQQRGLGRAMMELLEQIAWGAGMSKVMLTVFTENRPALAFYSKLGYRLDETSPDYSPASGHCSPLQLARSAGAGNGSGGAGSRCSPELGMAAAAAAAVAAAGAVGGGSGSRRASGSPDGGGGTTVSSSMAVSSGSGSAGGTGSGEGGGSGYHILSKRLPPDWGTEVRLRHQVLQQAPPQDPGPVLQAREEQPQTKPQQEEEEEEEPPPHAEGLALQPQTLFPLQQPTAGVAATAAVVNSPVAAEVSPAAVRAGEAEAQEPGSRKKQRTHDTPPDMAGAGRSASCGPEHEGLAPDTGQHEGAAVAGHDLSRNGTPTPIATLACAGKGVGAIGSLGIEQQVQAEQARLVVLEQAAAPSVQ